MGYDLTLHVPDELANALFVEAKVRQMSVEELAVERLGGFKPSADPPNYLTLAHKASMAPSARKSIELIDADIESGRQE